LNDNANNGNQFEKSKANTGRTGMGNYSAEKRRKNKGM
jgi:hypothetical protein